MRPHADLIYQIPKERKMCQLMFVMTYEYYDEPNFVKILPCLLNEWSTPTIFKMQRHIFNSPHDDLYKLQRRGPCLNNRLWPIDQILVHSQRYK